MDLHLEFLRPWWFLALLPIAIILWQAWSLKAKQDAWQKVIEPKFQTLLLGKGSQSQGLYSTRLALIGLGLIWILAVLALAGPSLKSVKLPAEKTQQGSVILLDLSLSMLADDMTPNRISRARFKLIDLLKQHPEQSIGLIGYAGTAHSIAPISEDNQTLLELLPSLNPLMMPKYGSDPMQAFELAEQMFKGAQINQGHLIWVTDDIETEQRKAIQYWLEDRNISLSILAVGTQTGGTVHIPSYGLLRDENEQIISPKLPYKQFERLSHATGAALTPLKVDESDLEILIPSNLAAIAKQNQENNQEKEVLHQLDDGTALILALLPLLAFAYRRGWLFSFALVMLLPIGTLYSPPSFAEAKLSDFKDVFQTPDQQGYKAWNQQDYQAAEALFKDPEWRGATLYRLEKYKEAAEQFKKDSSAQGQYNLGNALAKQGLLEEAKQAYEQSLKQQPDHADALANLKLIEQLLNQQQSEQDNGQSSIPSGDEKNGQGQTEESKQPNQDKPENSGKDPSVNQENPLNKESGESEQGNQALEGDKEQQPSEQSSDQPADSQQQSDTHPKDDDQPPSSTKLEGEKGSQGEQADSEQSSTGSAQKDNKQEIEKKQDSSKTGGLADREQTDQNELTDIREQEQQRATDNWLKQIPDQPGLFLKRKFEYQFQQQNGDKPPQSQPAEKIW
ncbi:MAG: VWA domain-containing protein [Pseudomonadota bacterium]|nr:VWA domain-containing protein [Pseudomonadota bacterium]